MPKYSLIITATIPCEVKVEAATEEEAEKSAFGVLERKGAYEFQYDAENFEIDDIVNLDAEDSAV